MKILLSSYQLQVLLEQAAEMGAKMALIKTAKIKPFLKKSEAYRAYGRTNIEKWIELGWITHRKDGNDSAPWRIDRIEVEAISKATYFSRYL